MWLWVRSGYAHRARARRRSGTFCAAFCSFGINTPVRRRQRGSDLMNGIVYIVGLIVIIMFILSFLGLR